EEEETLRRVRLNARQHASRQGWPSIVEQFEGYLYGACKQRAGAAQQAPGTALAIKPGSTAPRG
ncbi:MAG: glycosyltransferase family 1 protein, partial [Pseudomonas capeferrum]